MLSCYRWSPLALISLLLLVVPTQANIGELDRLLGSRIERNCFFSPMGCMFLPHKKFNRVRRLPISKNPIDWWLV
ncbi:hypothetical protein Q1695_007554 [Nippostrongylus brasiliensis]|nr:hypothetical protein Q1695_007554 [Nippostrongylus brasiliensis]